MSYLTAFSVKLAGLEADLDTYNQQLPEYIKQIDHQMLGGVIESAMGAFEFARQNAETLVDHLKIREAYNHHGLGEEETATIKLLHAAILNNPVQFENAFELHRKISSDKIFELTQHIAHAKTQTDLALQYAEILLNADWRQGTEIPADENPKWVWLTDGFFTYMEREASYNLKENKWVIKHKTTEPYFEIRKWMDYKGN